MPWILAYLILFTIIILAVSVPFWKGATWRSSLFRWFLLFSPVAIFMWDYPITYYRHVQDCKVEGGLKVYIQPEKVDEVQMGIQHFARVSVAEGLLKDYHPRLKKVEVGDGYYNNEKHQKDYKKYIVTVEKTTKHPYKNDWEFNRETVPEFSSGMYIISKINGYDKATHRSKSQWRLTKNGKLYATITTFVHSWPKIQYPDAVPAWGCERVHQQFRYPLYDLTRLILK